MCYFQKLKIIEVISLKSVLRTKVDSISLNRFLSLWLEETLKYRCLSVPMQKF